MWVTCMAWVFSLVTGATGIILKVKGWLLQSLKHHVFEISEQAPKDKYRNTYDDSYMLYN